MYEQIYKHLLTGIFMLEVLCLLVLAVSLLWLWRSVAQRRAGTGGKIQVAIAGTLVAATLLVGGGLALLGAKGLPWLIERLETQETFRQEQIALQGALIGQPAPRLQFAGVADDRAYTLDEFAGEVLLVNFWATWCSPCVREMPDLERLQKELGGRGLRVIHLSHEPRETLVDYLEKNQPANLHAYGDTHQWPSYALPTTFIVDREGLMRDVRTGMSDYDALAGMLEPYL